MKLETVLEHIENALNGKLLDDHGNRDDNGLDSHPDIEYVRKEVLAAWRALKMMEGKKCQS